MQRSPLTEAAGLLLLCPLWVPQMLVSHLTGGPLLLFSLWTVAFLRMQRSPLTVAARAVMLLFLFLLWGVLS